MLDPKINFLGPQIQFLESKIDCSDPKNLVVGHQIDFGTPKINFRSLGPKVDHMPTVWAYNLLFKMRELAPIRVEVKLQCIYI